MPVADMVLAERSPDLMPEPTPTMLPGMAEENELLNQQQQHGEPDGKQANAHQQDALKAQIQPWSRASKKKKWGRTTTAVWSRSLSSLFRNLVLVAVVLACCAILLSVSRL